MQILVIISDLIIPMLFVTIILFGYQKKIDIYEVFKEGVKEGFTTVLEITPTILGLMVAVGILNASGALDLFSGLIEKPAEFIGYPVEAVPLTFMRLVSSSASTGLLIEIFKTHGPDSYLGRFVSIMMSSTETVFYTISVYFMAVKITKTRYTLVGALIANFAGVAASLYIANALYT